MSGRWVIEGEPGDRFLRWIAETGVAAPAVLQAYHIDVACIGDSDEAIRAWEALVACVEGTST